MSQATAGLLRLLARRARSRAELVTALDRKGFAPDVISEALRRIDRFGYVNDEKFAEDRAERLLRHGKLGSAAVVARLVAAGIPDASARAAAAKAGQSLNVDEEAEARALLRARGIALPVVDARAYGKAVRTLSARGFSEDVVAAVVGAPPEVLE